MSRKERVQKLLGCSAAIENGLELPEHPQRYVALECDVFRDIAWACFGDNLDEIKSSLEESTTTGIERIYVHDLDEGKLYSPYWTIVRFLELPV